MRFKFLKLLNENADAGGSEAPEETGAAAEQGAPPVPAPQAENGQNSAESAPPALPQGQDGKSGVKNEPFYPEDLPKNMRGKDDRETIERLTKAFMGYRRRDSGRDVPKEAKDYADFSAAEVPEELKPYFADMANDPVFQGVAEAALKEGVDKNTLQKTVIATYAAAQQAGVLEPPLDVEKERQALLPRGYENAPKEAQDAVIEKRLNENNSFMQLMIKNGAISKEIGENALAMLMDTALGNQFLEIFRSYAQGEMSGQPFAGSGMPDISGEAKRAELDRRMEEVEKMRGQPGYQEAAAALEEEFKKFHGE